MAISAPLRSNEDAMRLRLFMTPGQSLLLLWQYHIPEKFMGWGFVVCGLLVSIAGCVGVCRLLYYELPII